MPQILIAEDSPTQAERLREALESRGFEVTSAPDGEEGLRFFAARPFDIVISDVLMPGMSGYEFCCKIKSDTAQGSVPVILLTSLNEPMDIIRGLECGADNFLTKPYQADDLIRRVERILDNRRLRGNGRASIGVDIMFLGTKFTITSDKEQILDLLISTFEDTVRANQELQRSRSELTAAKAKIQSYASELEDRVRQRTADFVRTNEELQSEIAARKQTQEQLVQAQKMEAIGNLTGGMAHDFNNLLGVIIGNLDLVCERTDIDAELKGLTGEALDAALRGSDLTRRLLAFARRQPLRLERIDVNGRVAGIAKLLGRILGEDIEVSVELDPAAFPIVADPAQLEAALTNLATNARDAMPQGGHLTIATRNSFIDGDYASLHPDVAPGDYVMIEVSDTGSGMSHEVMRHIFEPFYTTKERGKGTGLGLSMVFGYLKQSGGHINVYSEEGSGTTFRLYLPRAGERVAAQPQATSDQQPAAGRGETVLVVEDNASLRRVVVRQLRELNYHVLEAEDATAALSILERERVDLLFTDVIMPGATTGLDIMRIALVRWPGMRIVLTSGFPQTNLNDEIKSFTGVRLLSKPYRKVELARTLRQALAA